MEADLTPRSHEDVPAKPADSGDGPLSKAMRLLRVFPADGRPMSGIEASRLTGLSKTTVHRTLSILQQHELVRRLDSGWVLSWGLVELATRAQAGQGLVLAQVARPWMIEAYPHARAHAVHLFVLEGRQLVVAEKVGGPRAKEVPTQVGMKLPMETTAAGRAIGRRRIVSARAMVESPREWIQPAYRRDDAFAGVACAAAPVYRGPVVVGAVSISGGSDHLDGSAASKVACWIARRVSHDVTNAAAETRQL